VKVPEVAVVPDPHQRWSFREVNQSNGFDGAVMKLSVVSLQSGPRVTLPDVTSLLRPH
jgi:hypothetical protein